MRNKFLGIYNKGKYLDEKTNITANDFNKFIVGGGITFRDDFWKDEFLYSYQGVEKGIDEEEDWDKLYNAILESKNKTATSDIEEVQTYTSWKTANKGAFGETDEWWNDNANQDEIYNTFLEAGGNSNPLDARTIGDIRQTLSGAISEILTGENESLGTTDSSQVVVEAVRKQIKAENLSEKAAKDLVDELLAAKKQGGILPLQDEMLTQLLAKFAK